MLITTDLEGLKLVRAENIANNRDVLRAVEEAVMQGSQGWGVIDEQSVLLAVLIELRNTMARQDFADELTDAAALVGNQLKGKQMELGRTQKALKDITKRHADLLVVIKAQSETIAELTRERDDIRASLDMANERSIALT